MIKKHIPPTLPLKRLFFLITMIMTFSTLTFLPKQAEAASTLSDGAHLLSTEEEADLEKKCNDIVTRYGITVNVILSDKITQKATPDYLKKIENSKKTPDNLLVLLISTAQEDTYCIVQSFHQAKEAFPESRCKAMQKKLSSYLKRGDYYKAIYSFCTDTQNKVEKDPTLDIFVFQSLPQLILCIILSCISIYCYLYYHTRKEQRFPYILFPFTSGKLSFLGALYQSEHCQKLLRRHLDTNHSGITNSSDTYTHTD